MRWCWDATRTYFKKPCLLAYCIEIQMVLKYFLYFSNVYTFIVLPERASDDLNIKPKSPAVLRCRARCVVAVLHNVTLGVSCLLFGLSNTRFIHSIIKHFQARSMLFNTTVYQYQHSLYTYANQYSNNYAFKNQIYGIFRDITISDIYQKSCTIIYPKIYQAMLSYAYFFCMYSLSTYGIKNFFFFYKDTTP